MRKPLATILLCILVCINDKMMNLDAPVTIKTKGDIIFRGKLKRTIKNLDHSIASKGDLDLSFPVIVNIKDNRIVAEK